MTLSDIQTGTILKLDQQMKVGYILREPDSAYVYFDLRDVEKGVGLGVAQENHGVQFVQETDASGKLVAKHVTVMPGKSFSANK